MEGAHLFAVLGTPSGAVYAAGYRPAPPRFDSNGDGQINTDDTQSRYGVIFRYNVSPWEEMLVGTQNHINCLSVSGNDLLGASDDGELYRMTEQSPNTAFILADPPTSRDIADAIFNTRKIQGDESSDRLVKELELTTPETVWKLAEHTNETTLPRVTTETATTTVRIVESEALNFTHTPTEPRFKTTVTFKDTSDSSLEIIRWEWHVFREVSDGYETKAAVESDTGTAEVTISDLGIYDIGMQVTLKDGSTLHMQKEEALAIKGEGGGSGCFVGAASPQ